MILLEGGNYMGAFILVLIIMLSPALIMYIIGFSVKKNKPKTAKILFILATVYLTISLGICGSIMI